MYSVHTYAYSALALSSAELPHTQLGLQLVKELRAAKYKTQAYTNAFNFIFTDPNL